MQRFIWVIYAVFIAFLLIVFISTQASGGRAFGTDNIERLAPFAATLGIFFADRADDLGLDFQSVRTKYDSLDPHRSGIGTNIQHLNLKHDTGGAFLVVVTWGLLATAIAVTFSSILGSLSSSSAGSGLAVGCSGMWVVVALLIILVFLHGPLTDAASNLLHQRQQSSQSAPIQNRIDRVQQSWTPGTLNRSCHVVDDFDATVLTDQATDARICGASVKQRLTADAQTGQDLNPQTEAASLAFLGQLAELAKNGQILGVDPTDGEFIEFGTFATKEYPALRVDSWIQASQHYLGLIQNRDTRALTQDARQETSYNLDVLAERLWDSDNPRAQDMANRIAAVTKQQLHCAPSVLRNTANDSSLPTCQEAAQRLDQTGSGWVGTATGIFLVLVAVAIVGAIGFGIYRLVQS